MLDLLNIFKKKIPEHPAFARNHQFFRHFDQLRPIEEYDYVVVDTELTGLSKRRDEIVSIGAVHIKNLRIVAGRTFYSLVRPAHKIDATNSTIIHRITPQELQEAPTIDEILPDFVDFCGDALFVGHYIDLDTGFINKECRKFFKTTIKSPGLDTIRLAQIYTELNWQHHDERFNLNVSYNLTDLSRQYNLPLFPAHNALQDAIQTAYLFIFLTKSLQASGLETLQDLYTAGRNLQQIL
ncbi:MAG: 3'-5' exonuclease [Desulfobulbaceae bacterium]|nr:MAG: 3'-5' exonuclease [Desulfobulbaceae bacterium]